MIDQLEVGGRAVQTVVTRQPFYDTEWLDGVGEARFFRNAFHFSSAERGDKGRHHCNMYNAHWMCAKGMQFRAYRLVIFPTTEGVREPLADYRARVEEYRQSAVCRFVFGETVKLEVPLVDACANISIGFVDDPLKVPEEFDPTEAPEISYRRGVDLCVANLPYVVTEAEDCSVRLSGPRARGVGLKCYLAGILLKAVVG